MAFPSSPADGQVYNNYIYDAAKDSWVLNQENISEIVEISGVTVHSGKAITIESGKHRITNNDGGGNFNIRIGNKYDGGTVCTEDGYASHIVFDQGAGGWEFKTSTASATVGNAASFDSFLRLNPNGVGIDMDPSTNVSYGVNIGVHWDSNNYQVNYASQYHCQDNGRGDLSLTTQQGRLPGYPDNYYNVLKTSYLAMYFSVGGAYSGYMYASGSYTTNSSRDIKVNKVDIPFDIYRDKMSRIEVQQYEYINDVEAGDQKYIGPYAEDMKAEFDLGTGEMLSDKDTAGVALLGVKHLLQEVEDLKTRANNLKGI